MKVEFVFDYCSTIVAGLYSFVFGSKLRDCVCVSYMGNITITYGIATRYAICTYHI